jgi:hypothetical protein
VRNHVSRPVGMVQSVNVNPKTEHDLYLTLYVSNSGGV